MICKWRQAVLCFILLLVQFSRSSNDTLPAFPVTLSTSMAPLVAQAFLVPPSLQAHFAQSRRVDVCDAPLQGRSKRIQRCSLVAVHGAEVSQKCVVAAEVRTTAPEVPSPLRVARRCCLLSPATPEGARNHCSRSWTNARTLSSAHGTSGGGSGGGSGGQVVVQAVKESTYESAKPLKVRERIGVAPRVEGLQTLVHLPYR